MSRGSLMSAARLLLHTWGILKSALTEARDPGALVPAVVGKSSVLERWNQGSGLKSRVASWAVLVISTVFWIIPLLVGWLVKKTKEAFR